LLDNTILSLYEDSQGLIWVGSAFNGLSSLDPKTDQFIHYKHDPQDKNSITNNPMMAMLEDHRGDLWLGTQTDGLERFDRKTGVFSHYRHDPNDSNSLSESGRTGIIIEDSQHFLWIGSAEMCWVNSFCPSNKTQLN
jgi:ligand-binding sensor domain-containing protein